MGKFDVLSNSIIAHRGIYNNITIYQNTLESIMYAVRNNLTVKIDISITMDFKIIVFYKYDLEKLLKLKDDISTINYDELEYISNYHVPTLKEVLDKVNGRVPIIIDINEDSKNIRKYIVDLLKDYNGDIIIESFNYDIVTFYKKKNYISGLIISNNVNRNYLKKDLEVDFLSIEYDCIDKLEANVLRQKYYIIGWTIDSREDVDYFIKIFNNLIVDNIEKVFGG